ncbi:MAG: 30S ribosomal protein S20 [Planctomycetes bacterium]|nr:30S ribosomal protein S20 [Planctomycetota bacterium]
MPHTVSAAKRLRQSLERRTRNRDRTTELKTIRKQFLRALHDGKVDDAKGLYQRLSQRLDQASSLKVIHKNAAARVKSRMAAKLITPETSAKPVKAARVAKPSEAKPGAAKSGAAKSGAAKPTAKPAK